VVGDDRDVSESQARATAGVTHPWARTSWGWPLLTAIEPAAHGAAAA